jgi:hypothetical protein
MTVTVGVRPAVRRRSMPCEPQSKRRFDVTIRSKRGGWLEGKPGGQAQATRWLTLEAILASNQSESRKESKIEKAD